MEQKYNVRTASMAVLGDISFFRTGKESYKPGKPKAPGPRNSRGCSGAGVAS